MYSFFENIRVRTCDDLSFLVNIETNSFFVIKTQALNYLEFQLKEGLTIDKLNGFKSDFIEFIHELENQNILEVNTDEV